jgi:hypothetical protein
MGQGSELVTSERRGAIEPANRPEIILSTKPANFQIAKQEVTSQALVKADE